MENMGRMQQKYCTEISGDNFIPEVIVLGVFFCLSPYLFSAE